MSVADMAATINLTYWGLEKKRGMPSLDIPRFFSFQNV
jgi:hypothetical protein